MLMEGFYKHRLTLRELSINMGLSRSAIYWRRTKIIREMAKAYSELTKVEIFINK